MSFLAWRIFAAASFLCIRLHAIPAKLRERQDSSDAAQTRFSGSAAFRFLSPKSRRPWEAGLRYTCLIGVRFTIARVCITPLVQNFSFGFLQKQREDYGAHQEGRDE
jgi:hypothetical protein